MAASWKNLDICRIYSLHKECAFVDLGHKGNVVTSITFDRFGGFMMTSAGNELTLFNYKSWKKPGKWSCGNEQNGNEGERKTINVM